MEKSITTVRCRRRLRFGFLFCFLLWCLVVYCGYSALFAHNNALSWFSNHAKVLFVLQQSNSHAFIGNSSEINLLFPFTKNEENPVHVRKDRVAQVESHSMVENITKRVSKQRRNHYRMEIMKPILDSCSGRYIYVLDIPSRFNTEILKNCTFLLKWPESDMCQAILNMGLGPQILNSHGGVLQSKGWFLTHPNLLEVIFHHRMKQYKCLTNDSSQASAIYVPFYAGLDLGRFLWGFNASMRDSAPIDLFNWLVKNPEWRHMWGRDHFFVVGRTTWDFRRLNDIDSSWGNKLMYLPQVKNMTILAIESSPWIYRDFAIPYPTHFHPSNDNQVLEWQNKVRRQKRRYLFSFVGAPRPKQPDSIRHEIIDQCLSTKKACKWLDCSLSGKCDNPIYVMEMFQNSTFCLQPRGDSSTRRSTFDSILAGCIPVFFSVETAYTQYIWHLPKNYTKYSVFVPQEAIKNGTKDIEKTLRRISEDEVLAMREEVIRLIPRIMYGNPSFRLESIEDAFDIAIKGVLERLETIREEMKQKKQ